MPLLTIAMADVPAADAGLGSGITNVSQQISGALGLAVLSTIATNHTKGLLADGHGADRRPDRRLPRRVHHRALSPSAPGSCSPSALLRPRKPRPPMRVARPGAVPAPALAMEEQAA